MRVLIAVHKDIVSRIIIENRNKLANYLYYIVLDFKRALPRIWKNAKKDKDSQSLQQQT